MTAAIINTIIMVFLTLLLAVPIGIAAANISGRILKEKLKIS